MPEFAFTELNKFIKNISINGLYDLFIKCLNNSNKIPIKSELNSSSVFPSKIISLKHNCKKWSKQILISGLLLNKSIIFFNKSTTGSFINDK